ncbi:MAG: cohesin domain-containing protein [Candidatus Latescibacterota bacterium]
MRRTAMQAAWGAAMVLWGCGQDAPLVSVEGPGPRVVARLATVAQGWEVARVTLFVEGPGIEPPIVQTQEAAGERTFTFDVTVPVDATPVFRVQAEDSRGEILFAGTREAPAQEAAAAGIDILLTPTRFALLVTPSDTTVAAGSTLTVAVDVYHVEALFGASFEVEFDGDLLEAADAATGDFLGADVLELVRQEQGRVATSLVRKRGSGAQSGSGRLGQVVFRARGPGISALRIVPETLALQGEDGSEVGGRQALRTGGGSIRIE